MTLRLLSHNIRRGGAGREQPLAAVIRAVAPDIVVLEEATRPEVVECLARETGMQQWSARAGKSLAFMSRQPVTHFAAHRPAISRHAFLEIVPSTDQLARVWRAPQRRCTRPGPERRRLLRAPSAAARGIGAREGAARADWRLQHRGARAISSMSVCCRGACARSSG